jgi:hypothetical protein
VSVVRDLAFFAVQTIGTAIAGGFVGLLTACAVTGVVEYSWYLDSWGAAFRSFLIGAGTGGLFGFGWSVRRWYQRIPSVAEVEDELW